MDIDKIKRLAKDSKPIYSVDPSESKSRPDLSLFGEDNFSKDNDSIH